jgi:hypothetical protein
MLAELESDYKSEVQLRENWMTQTRQVCFAL